MCLRAQWREKEKRKEDNITRGRYKITKNSDQGLANLQKTIE